MVDKSVKYAITADEAGFAAAISRVNRHLADAHGRVGGMFGGLNDSFLRVSGMITAVGTLLAGGGFAAGVKHAIDMQEEMYKGAQKVGLTTQAFSELSYAAKLADLSQEEFTKGMVKLSVALSEAQQGQKEQVELFKRLRIDPAQIKDSDALLGELAERFNRMEDGARRTGLAVDWFGEKVGPKLIPFLAGGRAGIEALREEARKLGVTVSDDTGKRAEEFNDNLKRLKEAGIGSASVIAAELTPALIKASKYFIDATKEAGLFQGVLISIGALIAKGLGIDEVGELEAKWTSMHKEAAGLRSVIAEMQRVMAANPTAGVIQSYPQAIAAAKTKLDDLESKILLVSAELARMGNAGQPFADPRIVKGSPFRPDDKDPTPRKPVPPNPESYMAYYEAVLAEAKHAQSVLTEGRDYTKEQELAFWRDLSANLELTTKDRVAILRKMAELQVGIAVRSRKDREAIEREDIDAARDLALVKVNADNEAARAAVGLGQITQEQLLALEIGFEEQRYQIRRAALQARLEIMALDPETNPVEMRRIKNDLLIIEAEHQRALLNLKQALKTETAQPALNIWGAFESSARTAIEGVLNRMQSLRQGIASIMAAVRQAIVAELAKIIVAKIAAFAKDKLLALAGIGVDAARAGSGAAASQAGIPIIGPVLALAAMAAITAAVLAQGSRIPSAMQGWRIPSGVNPIAQLHEQEMVLPARHAKVIDDLANGGAGGAGGPPIVLQGMRHGNLFIAEIDALAAALNFGKRNFIIK